MGLEEGILVVGAWLDITLLATHNVLARIDELAAMVDSAWFTSEKRPLTPTRKRRGQ